MIAGTDALKKIKNEGEAMRYEYKHFCKFKYIVRYPKGYTPGKKYPVLLFLHGAGSRSTDIERLRKNFFFTITEREHEDLPFVCVAPHCYRDSWFDLFETLESFVEHIYSEEYTDRERLYLMGGSMGGYAAWQLAMSMPEYFAAAVPICGGGMYWNAGRLVNVPVWAFHGGKDPVVNVRESEKMVERIIEKGGEAKLTVYPEHQHDAWSDTYANPEVFEWYLSHKNQNTAELKNEHQGSALYG